MLMAGEGQDAGGDIVAGKDGQDRVGRNVMTGDKGLKGLLQGIAFGPVAWLSKWSTLILSDL
jgi:hypothetical protein